MKTHDAGDGLEAVSQDDRLVVLGNSVSDAVHAAAEAGLDMDYIASVLVNVAADYMRLTYGDESLAGLAMAVLRCADKPMPEQLQ